MLSLNNPKFNHYIDVIYQKELEIKDTADAPNWVNYLDLHLEFDEDGTLFAQLYDKRDDIDFPIVNFPYLGTCQLKSRGGGAMVNFEKNALPSNIKKKL